MDETTIPPSEKDSKPITKDLDDSGGTVKDAPESDEGKELPGITGGEVEVNDSEATEKPDPVSNNGIDCEVKVEDEKKNSCDVSSPSFGSEERSNARLPQSDEKTQRDSDLDIINETSDKTISEPVKVLVKNESEHVSETLEHKREYLDSLEDDGNECNNALLQEKEKEEVTPTKVPSGNESSDDKQLENIPNNTSNNQRCSNFEKDTDNMPHNSENMPYDEKEEENLNNVIIDEQSSKNDSSVMKSDFDISSSKLVLITEDQKQSNDESGVLVSKAEPNTEALNVNVSNINEELSSNVDNLNSSSEIVTPMDVESKESISDNVPDEKTSKCEEDVISTPAEICSGNGNEETDVKDESQIKSHATESQEKSVINESLVVQNASTTSTSPKNAFESNDDDEPGCSSGTLNSQTEKNEVLHTEMVNCNDETQMDVSENEKETEVNNIDTDVNDDGDKKQDDGEVEEMDVDRSGESETFQRDFEKKNESNCTNKNQYMSEESDVGQKEIISVEESSALMQPGGSEAETITGDTSSEGPLGDSRGKDAEICIIPDDVSPRLSTPSQCEQDKSEKESVGSKKEDISLVKEDGKTMKDNCISGYDRNEEKLKQESKEKSESDQTAKARPVRVAAKLAGNKIKTLVQNDFDPAAMALKSNDESRETKCNETTSCSHCGQVKQCKFEINQGGRTHPLCSEQCYNAELKSSSQLDVVDAEPGVFTRKCGQCRSQITGDENILSWETMEFCNEECLGKYQRVLGSHCANCKGNVPLASLGKYCVRFGYDIKQFCTSVCLEEYKKGLKVCSYCQKDISTGTEGFLAPVGDKGQFKDFCTQSCMEKYEQMSNNIPPPSVVAECAVCSNSKPVRLEVQIEDKTQQLCSEPCFAAFKFVNNLVEGQCDMCKKYFDPVKTGNFSIYYEDAPHTFCCKACMNVYILANRKIIPCNWCKVKKYNFDMIKKVSVTGQVLTMCSLNCLTLHQVSVNAASTRRTMCDFCLTVAPAKYHLTMSDATVRNFCGYTCVMSFEKQYPKQAISLPATECLTTPIPTGGPKRILPRRSQSNTSGVPVISSVKSLASPNGPVSGTRVSIPASDVGIVSQVTSISQPITIQPTVPPPAPQVYQQIITKPAPVKQQKNKSVLCKPYSHTKGVSCRPHPCMKETQTDESLNRKFLIPVPVPIYVPAPMHMYSAPYPVPIPIPLPVPVPIFIPTTRNSAKGIFKEIKKIQEKIPTDPFEAELLMMAEMVAGEKKHDPTDSESDDGGDGDEGGDGTFSPENVDTSNTFGDDMLQMALKMATEMEEPAVDMESVLTSNTITPTTQPSVDPNKGLYDDPDQVQVMPMNRGRKRSVRGGRNSTGGTQSKRGRRISGTTVDVPIMPPPEPVPPPRIEVEKPDANMCLKYTFGVNAWRHWVMQKNAELEKVAMTNRKIKLFKPELLQLTADELNFSLCLFVKEVRKPNGTEYAPDTIYYLCLGIQQYLFENGRIDNIFTDSYYEKFTDCLDEVAKKFAALYNDSQYIVTRVEEEHLWESKQLGAHSPHVLLSTLMFFNTKHFNLVTVEEHMQLSFSHIMKHWKRNPNAPGVAKVPGSRNVLLRFYPPQSALEANSRKKKVYEQQENEENPLRCPVKLYEFYLSKCPESVKTRNDVFYLLPERSCVPDSPVWYSTMALGKEPLTKMLHRVKMVKEINIALLTC